ncbi:MAG TPA: hypothetical protein VF941_14295 [Clostridia bacterium]
MAYPTTLDGLTTSASGTEVLNSLGGGVGLAPMLNNADTAINALETKVGVDGSAVTTSIDYLLKNTASTDPGHKHTSASLSGTTGTGNIVLATSSTLVTPSLGVATATSVNKVAITAPATSATLTIADGKTLTASNSLTLAGVDGKTLTVNNSLTIAGTDGTTMTFPSSSDTVVTLTATQTITNKRRTRRFVTTTQSATPAINSDNGDVFNITGLAQAITSMTTNLTGTPTDGDLMEIRITDNGTARAITWGASFESTTVTLPTTTVISTMLRTLFEWNATASKWDCVAVA